MTLLASYAAGTASGRKAVALPTGYGKTSAVVAFIASVWELHLDVAVAVAASQVEALCSIKRELMAQGVPEELIGLKHSQSDASLPSTGDDDRPIMLVTHARVKVGRELELFGRHKGRDRAVMIWDESLLRAESIGVEVRELRAALNALEVYLTGAAAGALTSAHRYIAECARTVERSLAALRQHGDPEGVGVPLDLSMRSEGELEAYRNALRQVVRLPTQYREALTTMLEISQEPLRVLALGADEGLVWTRESVPEQLRNVVVLDASYPVRELMRLDPTIEDATPAQALGVMKSFEEVTITQLRAAGGRTSITRRAEDAAVVREVVDIVRAEWARSKGILVFTFKPRGSSDPDHLALLRKGLREAGFDPDQLIYTGDALPDGSPRHARKLQGLTFGQETSLNGFEFCDVVILVGVLHRSQVDIAAAIRGQQGDLAAPTPLHQVRQVIESEVAHTVYQALSRGSCRRVTEGRAWPMRGYLIHKSTRLRDALLPVMPGVQWAVVEPRHLKPARTEDVAHDLALRIIDHLREVPDDRDAVSSKEVKEALGVGGNAAEDKAFSRAAALVGDLSGEWSRGPRGFVRRAARYGFLDRTAPPPSLLAA